LQNEGKSSISSQLIKLPYQSFSVCYDHHEGANAGGFKVNEADQG
jgi:hypothetical protein